MVKRIKFEDGVEYRNEVGQHHREDGPAVEWVSGSKAWYRNGQCHREDGPAVEGINGSKSWWCNGQCHREDGPAIEENNGAKYWYLYDVEVNCFEYSEDEVCKEICIKCKRNTKDGCVGGLELCPFKMEQIVCS